MSECSATGATCRPRRRSPGFALLALALGGTNAAIARVGDEEAAKWNVDAPPGESRWQEIDTTSGTWMNLDVDPRGEWIVFDLLGDLYKIPLAGGEAQALTSGIAWDMQPRFSPDGSSIAFTSDRTGSGDRGGDNLWVMDRDGGSLRQVSAETFRLVNGPAWSPDGRYLVGRKHFSSRRSLGAGEMWMYPVSGVEGGATAGLQLTDRRTDQKDVNEPVFDPKGRYLYYSEDVTPGATFEYDKDSNGQIYVIQRLDLERQETETWISGPGGACRPTPSPDGATLAFVRRVGERTGLHLFHAEDQRVELLDDDLERDMQEAWAIHGVYPTFAFTPDGSSIVFWARGGLHRLVLADRSVHDIPFHVKDRREVRAALRFPVEVSPDSLDVKMLRWVEVSPDGTKAVFQALGRLWLTDLNSGARRTLTQDADPLEFFPHFSRDGSQVVYVTWDDEKLGEVRTVPVAGGPSVKRSGPPAHYLEPVLSPDGKTLIVRRGTGGGLTTPLYSQGAGLYGLDLASGDEWKLATDGTDPHFGAGSDRLFLTRRKGGKDSDSVELLSVDLRGHEERVHFESDWAQELRVSPDGRTVAAVERYRVYLVPFLDTGRPMKLAPSSTALPIGKLADGAGQNVHFSNGGAKLHWSLGPTLTTVDVPKDFTTKSEPPARHETALGFSVPTHVPERTIALVGGRIVTLAGEGRDAGRIVEDGTLVIRGNRIVALGARNEVTVPAGAEVLELHGRTVMPGLVDVHAHGSQGENGITPRNGWVDLSRLAFGVTTVHDPSNDTEEIFANREMIAAGRKIGPRTYSTGTILYGATGSFKAEIDSLEDARFHLERLKAVGAFSVKSYNQPRRDQRQQVIAAARELGMMVVPEGGSTFFHNLSMIVDGHTGIEHTLPVEMVYDDVLDLWRGTGVGYTPTLVVAYGGLGGENWWYQTDDLWKHPRLSHFVPPHVLVPRSRRRLLAPQEDYNHFRCARIADRVQAEGGLVQAGGHGQLVGIDTHWELWMFVQGGMTPAEALRCGTLLGARYLGLDRDIGSLEVGKLADLCVLEPDRDPTARIRDSEFVEWVFANGEGYEAATLRPLFGGGEAPTLYFGRPGYSAAGGVAPIVHCAGCGR